jgi:hypothetical protein
MLFLKIIVGCIVFFPALLFLIMLISEIIGYSSAPEKSDSGGGIAISLLLFFIQAALGIMIICEL